MPTLRVDLLDTKATMTQKRRLVQSLTNVVAETLGDPKETVTIVFKSTSKGNIAREGRLGIW